MASSTTITSSLNSSSLMLVAGSSTASITLRNSTALRNVASNAYEWRFLLPPYILIFILSITGNCLVIATLASNRRMRTVTNVYLLNLAVSDFLLGVFCMPITVVGQICRRFFLGVAICKLVSFLQAVVVSVDVWTLVAISLERYFAICRPLKSRRWQTQGHAYKMIATVWIMAFMINSPILYVATLQSMRGNVYKCRESWSSLRLEIGFNLAVNVSLHLVPLFIITVAYSLIVSKLWRGMRHEIQHNFNWQRNLTGRASCKSCRNQLISTQSILRKGSPELDFKSLDNWHTNILCKENAQGNGVADAESNPTICMHTSLELDFRHAIRSTHIDKSIEAKRKVIRMLFVIILEFFVCWTPLHLNNTLRSIYGAKVNDYISYKSVTWLHLLAFCSSCCNPITYCFMNRKFRQAFINFINGFKLFSWCFSVKSDGVKQPTPQPSSQDMTACVIRGSHTGRTELEALEGEECV